jgi:hypothetical protein
MSRAQVIRVGLAALSLLLLAGLAAAGIAWAGSSDAVAVDWSVLSVGGAPAESSSGTVALNGSLGQTAIGPGTSPHADLSAGFWYSLGTRKYAVYLPVVLRKYD